MTKWQPIETAPRDGRRILLTDGSDVVVGWSRGKGFWVKVYEEDSVPMQTKAKYWAMIPALDEIEGGNP